MALRSVRSDRARRSRRTWRLAILVATAVAATGAGRPRFDVRPAGTAVTIAPDGGPEPLPFHLDHAPPRQPPAAPAVGTTPAATRESRPSGATATREPPPLVVGEPAGTGRAAPYAPASERLSSAASAPTPIGAAPITSTPAARASIATLLPALVDAMPAARGTAGCTPEPRTACAASDRRSALALPSPPRDRSLRWSWRTRTSPPGMFPDPYRVQYTFCVYDATTREPLLALALAEDAACRATRPPCWQLASGGFSYRSPRGARGKTRVRLVGGAGPGSIRLRSEGAPVALTRPPGAASPLVAQLVAADGRCWQADYPARDVASIRAP